MIDDGLKLVDLELLANDDDRKYINNLSLMCNVQLYVHAIDGHDTVFYMFSGSECIGVMFFKETTEPIAKWHMYITFPTYDLYETWVAVRPLNLFKQLYKELMEKLSP